jgi:hypothetical protein
MNAPDQLSEALRELAAASPQGLPAEVGKRLHGAFVQHHARRRRQRNVLLTGVVLCVLVLVTGLWKSRSEQAITAAKSPVNVHERAGSASPPAKTTNPRDVEVAQPPHAAYGKTTRPKKSATAHRHAPTQTAETADFVALPTFDPAMQLGPSRTVRMDLPGTALQLMGYPVDEELIERRVLTDVLVSHDGMPYAVRLIQARDIH